MKSLQNQTKDAVAVCIVIAIVCIALNLSGCGQSDGWVENVPGPTVTVSPSPNPSSDAIQSVVAGYNQYLVSQGSDPIQPGLRCTLYTVPNMPATPCILAADVAGCTTISSTAGYASVATFTYTGEINQPNESGTAGFNMLPTALQPLYATNFAVTCTGYFVGSDYAYHNFNVVSDDGSLVYIGGTLVLQNDGEHASQSVSSEKYLEAEVYSFQLNYFQGPGNVQLVVNEDGALLPAEALYH